LKAIWENFDRNFGVSLEFHTQEWPKMVAKHGGFLMFSGPQSLIPMELVNGLIQPGEHQLGCQPTSVNKKTQLAGHSKQPF